MPIVPRSDGTVLLAGYTSSDGFPTTPGALQPAYAGETDAFLAWVNAEGSGLIYGTYLGGSNLDSAFDMDADDFGTVYVSGVSLSTDFPAGGDAFPGNRPGFVSTFLFDDAAPLAGLSSGERKGLGALGVFRTVFWGSPDGFANLNAVDALRDASRRSQGAIVAGSWINGQRAASGDFLGGPCSSGSGVAMRLDSAGRLVGGGCLPGLSLTGAGYLPAHGAHLSGANAGETSAVLVLLPEFLKQGAGELHITDVFDAASGQPLISPGAIVSVYGDFAEQTASTTSVPLPESVEGFSVTFNDIPGSLFGVFDGAFDQSNVQVPWNLDVSSGKVEVKVHWADGGPASSEPFEANAALASPGIFLFPPGTTRAIVTNFKVSGDDGVIDGSWAQPAGSIDPIVGQPARIGGVVTIWGTGLGPVTPLPASGGIAPPGTVPVPDKPVRVFVGGVEAQLIGAALQPFNVGLNQINIFIPAGVTPGDAVPIVIEVDCGDGTVIRSREDVTIAIGEAE